MIGAVQLASSLWLKHAGLFLGSDTIRKSSVALSRGDRKLR